MQLLLFTVAPGVSRPQGEFVLLGFTTRDEIQNWGMNTITPRMYTRGQINDYTTFERVFGVRTKTMGDIYIHPKKYWHHAQ